MSSVVYNVPHLANHLPFDSNLVKGPCRKEYPNSNKKLIESLTTAIHQLNTFVMEPPNKFSVVDSVISKATNARNELVSFLSYLNSISSIQRHMAPHHSEVLVNDSSESLRSPSPTPQYSPTKFHSEYGSYSAPPPSQQIRPPQADSITAQSHPGDGDMGYGGYYSDVFSEYQTNSHSEYLREDSETYDTAMGVVAGILTPSASPAPPPPASTTTTSSPPVQQRPVQQPRSQLPMQPRSRASSSSQAKKSNKRGNKKSRKSSSNSSVSTHALSGDASGRIASVSSSKKKKRGSGRSGNVARDLTGSTTSARSMSAATLGKSGGTASNLKNGSTNLPTHPQPTSRTGSVPKVQTLAKAQRKRNGQLHSQSHAKRQTSARITRSHSNPEVQATGTRRDESYEPTLAATGSRVSLTPPPVSRVVQHHDDVDEIEMDNYNPNLTPSPRFVNSSSASSRGFGSRGSPQPASSSSPLRPSAQPNPNGLSPETAVRIAVAAMKSREHSSQSSSGVTDSLPRSCDTSENSVSGSGSDSGSAGDMHDKDARHSNLPDQTPSWSALCGQKTTSSPTRKLRTRASSSSTDVAKSNATPRPRPARPQTNKLRRSQPSNSKNITTSTAAITSPRKQPSPNSTNSVSTSDPNRQRTRQNGKQQPAQSNRTSAPRHSKRRGNDESLMRRVFVSNLPHDATDEQIRQTFGACGEIKHTVWFPSRTDGRFYGSGLISFKGTEGAANAVLWNKKTVMGRTIRVEYSACQDPIKEKPPGCCTTYLNNVPLDITEERIRQVFKHCGRILRVRFHERDGQRTGGAFIQFQDTHAADKALLMHGSIVDGFPLYVDYQRY